MTLALVLALDLLYDDVVARFAAEATEAAPAPTIAFGWREPAHREGLYPRVVYVPGDDESGDLGEVGPARQLGRDLAPLATLFELFTVYLEVEDSAGATAVDRDSALEDERRQYRAARLLFDAWWRHQFAAAGDTVAIQSARWVKDRATRRFGATLRIVCTVQAMIPDLPPTTIAGPDDAVARGAGTTELHDLEEYDETGPAPSAAKAASTSNVELEDPQTIDGVALVAADRVLLVGQTDPVENGLWLVASGAWSRAADELVHGTHVYVEPGGTANGDAGFRVFTPDPFVVGTDPFVFERVSPPLPPLT